MPPSDLPGHTSASQLGTYSRCPRAYAYKYIEHREPEARAPGMALGSAVHSSLAWFFEQRAQEREPTIDVTLKVLGADLAAATAFDNMRWGETTADELEADAERLVRVFISEKRHLPIVDTEVRFDFVIVDPDTGEQMPRPIIGYFDAELANGNLVELKTAKRAYSEIDLRVGLQFSAYRTAARYYGVDVELMALVRTKTPRLQHAVLPHDRDVSRWFMRTAASIERTILAGHFPPAPGMACSSCEYRGACLGAEAEVVDDDLDEAA
jgi:CRISPR/Cas system-associated exonuclease Cas4 (RecB family)